MYPHHHSSSVPITALVYALCVMATLALAHTAAAADDSVTVRRSPDPQATNLRLQQAAARLCGAISRVELARYRAWVHCFERNLESAVKQMHEPALLAIHRRHVANGSTFTG
jgi:hypothetical protein